MVESMESYSEVEVRDCSREERVSSWVSILSFDCFWRSSNWSLRLVSLALRISLNTINLVSISFSSRSDCSDSFSLCSSSRLDSNETYCVSVCNSFLLLVSSLTLSSFN